MITFSELIVAMNYWFLTGDPSIYWGMTVWSTGVIRGSQIDCLTQLHQPHPEDHGMLLTTTYVVCGTGCVGAVGRAPWVQTRSLGKREFTLVKEALEMKFYKGFYNFHNWDYRGFLIYHSRLPAGLFLKKSACYKFFPPSKLMLLDYRWLFSQYNSYSKSLNSTFYHNGHWNI